ncbi:MAG: hypothetical protein ABT03_02920 [Comamonas sp. SCN 67-35]|uniref:zonular occludens toxin domain-containing protein n=1 Tax=unclassified Comamonas TaxID=2638500 RepID=UPI00086E9933|nr:MULTISPECIES: zonular occludens toxin domain-containing protein [unclassified Comamonas]MBN9330127.1 hypothetical protein [Comamonas sp.]ODU39473.1 MAG: hypothetical protein ABT03_02920 [Comamonas sp. SCN 67-35]OJW99679.1 MAG: hypothetical protein BGO73_09435 [Burkholderiales bacterium 66-26]
MITLITGTPGAGKTLYAISKLLRDLVGSVVKSTDQNGQPVETPRRILTNIPRLLLDHELIGPDAGGGLADWQQWCQPGDVIAYDEVQRCWPPRANGSKVPDYISALETHRHKGVDFILITQHPMLLDRNVRALVGRHLHVRRIGGMGASIVYEWDHCSQSLMYSKALKKSPFKYDKSAFNLYLSSELHTKPKTSIPPLLYVVGLALVAAAVLVPTLMNRIASKGAPAAESKPASSSVPGALPSKLKDKPIASGGGSAGGKPYDVSEFVPVVSYEPRSAPIYDALRQVVTMPRIVGQICVGEADCYCMTQQGTRVNDAACAEWADMSRRRFDPYKPDSGLPAADPSRPVASLARGGGVD